MENDSLIQTKDRIYEHIEHIKTKKDMLYFYLPYAFLEIYIEFERFLSVIFEKYSLGLSSSMGFTPERNLNFSNIDQLRAFLRNKGSSFILYLDKIEELSDYIFKQDCNPFECLLHNAKFQYTELKNIRNYLAHKSDSSYDKLVSSRVITNSQSIEDYFSKKKKGLSINYFDYHVEQLIDISNLIIKGIS